MTTGISFCMLHRYLPIIRYMCHSLFGCPKTTGRDTHRYWRPHKPIGRRTVSSSASFFQTMLEIGGVETPYRNDSLSVTSALFIERPRVYLNDHNEARTLDDVGMLKEDFKMLEEKGIR